MRADPVNHVTAVAERPATPQPEIGADPVAAPKPERKNRLDIQGLRAVAVTLVVLYHAHVPGLSAGYVGVDVFFVISGFLITGQIAKEIERNGRLNLIGFYARRMRRLLPAAITVVVATVVAARLFGPVLQVKSTALDGVYSALYAINFHLAAKGVNYQQANGPVSPLQHFWSLAVEEQFYIVWPLIIIAATVWFSRRHATAVRPVLWAVAAAGTAASLWASVTITGHSAPLAYFSVQTRAWEFGFGALVALAATRLRSVPKSLADAASWIGLVLVVASAFVYSDATAFPGTAALWPVAGATLFIAAGTVTARTVRTSDDRSVTSLLGLRPFQWTGQVSYGWYLWHFPMLILAPALLGFELSWIRGVEISILALWLAAITHAVIERPTQKRPLRRIRWTALGVSFSLVAVLVAATVFGLAPRVAGDGKFAKPLDLSSPSLSRLQSALKEASAVHALPGNLNPSLDKAGNNVPVTQSGCHLDFLQVHEGACAYGDVNSIKTVVLFGDSHAQQWDGGLIAAATALHLRLVSWTKAACPFAQISLINPQLQRRYTECDKWRIETVSKIRALHPFLVIGSQSDSVPGRGVTNSQWASDTARTALAVKSKGTNVIFLSDTPYPKSDVPTCVAANLANVQRCEIARSDVYQTAALSDARHRIVAETLRSSDVTVVDPINWLCSASACPVVVGNTLVYRDGSHITNAYSKLLGPILEPLLQTSSK